MHPGFKVEDRHKKDVSPDLGFCSIHPVNDDRADISSYEVYKILYFTPKLKTDTARYGTFGGLRPGLVWRHPWWGNNPHRPSIPKLLAAHEGSKLAKAGTNLGAGSLRKITPSTVAAVPIWSNINPGYSS
ncbi:hypothetical protein VTP01DRAFT_2028 [Rhizomucor pusillus]|uniref:uncharacterized protein n=1 Tax=Rhizomucor pusillus TaxID=4840 RepID=UPI0037440BCC